MAKLTINQVLQQAVDAHKAGQSQQAHRLYAAILKAQPKHPDANHNIGLLTVGFGDIKLALPFFKTALEANPSMAQFWYSYIVALIKLERLTDGKVLLDQARSKGIKGVDFDQLEQKLNDANKALLIKPNEADGYYNMGVALQKQNKLEEAIEAYNKVLFIKPDYANAYNNMGTALQNQGKLKEAIEAYNKVLSIKPDNTEAYYNMGNALQEQNKLEEAIKAYNKILSIKPDYASAYSSLGIALQKQGKLKEAIEAYNKVLSIKPDNAEAYYNMGNALQEQNKLDEAIETYNKALAIKPDYEVAYNNMGNALKDQSKLEEAIGAYNKALAFKPDYADAYNNMGIVLKDQGKLKEALEAYNKALAIKPDYTEACNNIGVVLKDQGKLKEAIEAYNKALSIKPNYAEAYSNMGIVLNDQGKLKEAIEAYNKALTIKPDNAEAYSNMGIALAGQGKLKEAIKAYNKALTIKPDNAEAYNNMGIALNEQGKMEEAIKAYNRALAIKPDYADAARNFVKVPIGSIDEETILGLNKQFSILSSNIQNQSQRLFFEANLFTHKGEYEEAFKRFVEANHIKSNEISSVVKNLTQNYYKIVNRIQRWSSHTQKQTEYSLKKLFLLGPSRSGKSSLEALLMRIPKIYPMYENINLNTLYESDVRGRKVKNFDMTELFYHDEKSLLNDGYSFVTSTSPESMFHIDQLLDGLINSFCVLVKRDQTDVASEIFTKEYEIGNFYSYTHSSIQDYLNTYSVIWEEIKRKAPQRTLEIEYEDILVKPKEVLGQINQFTRENLILDNAEQYSTKMQISPFREHYAQKFKSSINQGFEIKALSTKA